MPFYFRTPNGQYFTASEQGSRIQRISEQDIVGRRGTGGSLEKVRQEGDIRDVDPSQIRFQARPEGGYDIFDPKGHLGIVSNLGEAQALGITAPGTLPGGEIGTNQAFSQYLGQTGQTYNNGQFSGSASVPRPNISREQILSEINRPRVLGSLSDIAINPQELRDVNSTRQVSRDAYDNFYVDGRKIELPEFKKLGINADFVPRGSSVPLGQAITGSPTGTFQAQNQTTSQIPPNIVGQVVESMKAQGYVINPKANLDDPTVAAEFLKRAEAEVSPAYQAQFKLAREQILRNQGYDLDSINLFEKNLEQRYGEQLRGIGEQAGEVGFAQSGRRMEAERNLAQETQQEISEKRRQLGFQAGSEALGFIERFGSRPISGFGGLSSLTQRTLGEAPQVAGGSAQFARTGRQLPFYSLSTDVLDGIVGSQQKQRQLDIEGLSQAYRTNRNFGRTLPS